MGTGWLVRAAVMGSYGQAGTTLACCKFPPHLGLEEVVVHYGSHVAGRVANVLGRG